MRLLLALLVLLAGPADASFIRQLSAGVNFGFDAAKGDELLEHRTDRISAVSSKATAAVGRSYEAQPTSTDTPALEVLQHSGTDALPQQQQQPGRRLAGSGGGKGGTINTLGLAVSTRSGILGSSAIDRIHSIHAKAHGFEEAQPPVAGYMPEQQQGPGRRRRLHRSRLLAQIGGRTGSGGFSSRDIVSTLEQRKAVAALSSMIGEAVNGDRDVMSAVTAGRGSRAWEVSLGRGRQQETEKQLSGRRLLLV